MCACGKQDYLVSGTVSSGSECITNGRFVPAEVKSDFAFDGYTCTDAAFLSEKFFYSFINYSDFDIKLLSFNSDGSSFSETTLQLPFTMRDGVVYSENYASLIDSLSTNELNLYFYNPFFDDDLVCGYCGLSGVAYPEDEPVSYISEYFLISWNLDGSIYSVESVSIAEEGREDIIFPQYVSSDNNGNVLTITDSGIVRSSADGKYLDTFFDFINSSYVLTLDKVVYADEDTFSALTYYADDSLHISVFNKSDKDITGVTPISLYCSSLSDDLLKQVIDFNVSSKEYRIGVKNYSDIIRDYSDIYADQDLLNDRALLLLEEDILSGDIPDLIYEFDGCDTVFVNRLSSGNIIVDIKDSMKNDKSLKGNKYLINVYDLHQAESVYALIPSFTFDTYVTSALNENISRNWSLDDFRNYKSLVGSDTIILDSYESSDFITRALAFNGYSWIDVSTGDATFGDDFKAYLELASQLPSSEDEFYELALMGKIPVNIHIFSTSIGNLAKDYLHTWKLVYSQPINVGFPTNTNSDRVIHPSGTLMICSDRVAAPGCWEFAKRFLLKSYQDGLVDYIPVVQSSYENWQQRTSYEGYPETDLIMNIDGQLYTAPELGTDKVDLLSNMIMSCDKFYFNNPEIEEIVLRNASYYFDGSVTADEAAANAEKEVEEYLSTMINAS